MSLEFSKILDFLHRTKKTFTVLHEKTLAGLISIKETKAGIRCDKKFQREEKNQWKRRYKLSQTILIQRI